MFLGKNCAQLVVKILIIFGAKGAGGNGGEYSAIEEVSSSRAV